MTVGKAHYKFMLIACGLLPVVMILSLSLN